MSDIEMLPVTSSNLEAVGYLPEEKLLVVRFKGGTVYHYTDVPPEAHAGLMGAPSKGSYLNSIIKPNYRAAKQPVEKQEEDGGEVVDTQDYSVENNG